MDPRFLAILGPTASGKSDLALRVARRWGAEILSVDSVQVYQEMDIGTAKPSSAELAEIRHHMIDVVPPHIDYSVADFQQTGRRAMASVLDRETPLVVVGGSGLYFRALVDPLEFPPVDAEIRAQVASLDGAQAVRELLVADPGAADHVDLSNPRRVGRALEILRLGAGTPSERASRPTAEQVRNYEPAVPFMALGVDPGPLIESRIRSRIDLMIEAGLLDEVIRLADRLGRNASLAVGYRQLLPVVYGTADLAQGRADIFRATLALAKRQRTYFGRDPRIRWLAWDEDPEVRWRAAYDAIEETSLWSS